MPFFSPSCWPECRCDGCLTLTSHKSLTGTALLMPSLSRQACRHIWALFLAKSTYHNPNEYRVCLPGRVQPTLGVLSLAPVTGTARDQHWSF